MPFKTFLLTSLRKTDVYNKSLNHTTVKARCFAFNSSQKNPYDVLGLKSTCSTQDVKKAYIKLCKELHPDVKPGDASQHKKFVELNNAYTSLIDAQSRKEVDHKSSSSTDNFQNNFYWNQQKASGPFAHGSSQKEESWYEREDYKQQFPPKRNVQNGIKKSFALALCFFLVSIGSLFYFSAYRYATNYTVNTVDERSRKISEGYQDLRKKALVSGRDEQLEKLKKKWSL